MEQQKKAEEEDEQKNTDGSVDTDANKPAVEVVTSRVDDEGASMIYLKKWVRTKHAILFRLSNGTVQVVFYDHTEVGPVMLVFHSGHTSKEPIITVDEIIELARK